MKICVNCNSILTGHNNSIRCKSCARKLFLRLHPNFLKGKNNPNFGNHILSIKNKGKNNPNYKDGHTTYQHYCKCGKKINREAKQCKSCFAKSRVNILSPNYKNGKTNNNKCITCGKHISYNAKRCKSCAYKNDYKLGIRKSKKGKLNNRYGKSLKPKFMKYKKIMFRSSWEVAYAKYLDRNNIKWQYEPKAFDLGSTTYTPDFYLPEFNLYIEIKGYKSDIFKQKFRLFKIIYKKIKIQIFNEKKLNKSGIIK